MPILRRYVPEYAKSPTQRRAMLVYNRNSYLAHLPHHRRLILALRRAHLLRISSRIRNMSPLSKPKRAPLVHVALAEAESRMEDIQRQNRRADNGALEPDKVLLRLDQMAFPALTQLCDTIHGAGEDAQRSESERE